LKREILSFVLASLVPFAGCGKSDWGYLEGTVKSNGQAVGPGTITLEPADGIGVGAMAFFQADGKYSVMSAGRKAGTRTGEYIVTVQGGESFGEENPGPRPKSAIPPKYADAKTSGLKVTIEPGTKNFDIELAP
jgi:hypothetical protein